MSEKIIEFIRKKDYELLEELGQGACGKTVLLNDSLINQKLVCKKYIPYSEKYRESLFKRFIEEIKILFLLHHLNIVRIYNCYIYPDIYSAYILMEYIEGDDIEKYIKKHPENLNDIFFQAISGFKHLEENNVLHRDIRPKNILVSRDGILKIIDFGFGKQIILSNDFDKSISLNWWCELPNEFKDGKYDYSTEVYFIGKLFKKIINENKIKFFQYEKILKSMCKKNPSHRVSSFREIYTGILSNRFDEIDFSEEEIKNYRNFSATLHGITSDIENGAKYYSDINIIQKNLEDLYKKVMLERYLPNNNKLIECFINGNFRYFPKHATSINILKSFISLLKSCPIEKKNIIISNIHSKLDSIDRFDPDFSDEDIPF